MQLATIHILRKHVLGDFLTHPPSPVLKYVIFEWSLTNLPLSFQISYLLVPKIVICVGIHLDKIFQKRS